MGVKIYENEARGRVIFDNGRRRRSAPLGGVVQASAYVRGGVTSTSRITIVRNDKFKRDGVTPRRIFRRLPISRVRQEDGTYLVSGLGYNMTQVIDYINSLGTSSPNDIEFKKDGVSLGKGNILDFVGFTTATRSSKTLTLTAPTGGGGGGGTGIGSTRSDNEKLNWGNDNDLQIYHDGSHSYISDEGTGNLKTRTNNFRVVNTAESKTSFTAQPAAGVELYYDNSKKLETTNGGVSITGFCTASSFSGDVGLTTGYLYNNLIGAPLHPTTINEWEYYQQYATAGDGNSGAGPRITTNTPPSTNNPYYYGTQVKPGEEMVWTHTVATQGLSIGRWSGTASYVPAWASNVTYWSRSLAFMHDHVDNYGGTFDSVGFGFIGAGSSYPITTNVTQLALRYRANDYKLELRDLTNDVGIATATAAEDGNPVTISFSIPTNQHLPNISTVRSYSQNLMFTQNTGVAATSTHHWSDGPLFYGEKLKKGDELILTAGTNHWQVGLWGGSTTEVNNLTSPSKWTAKWYFKPSLGISYDTNASYGITGVDLRRSIDLNPGPLTHSIRWDYVSNKLELWEEDGAHSWHIDSATVAMGVTESYIHFTSFSDGYEPGGVSQKRVSEYTKISAGSDPHVPGSLHIRDGFKAFDVWKHNYGFKPGMKLKFSVPTSSQNIYYSNDYVGSGDMTTRDTNNYTNGDMTWRISQFEKIHQFERCGMNTSYTAVYDDMTETRPIPARNLSWRYHLDNSWDIFDEDTDEVVLTGDNNYDGNDVCPYILPVGGSSDLSTLVFDWEPDFNGAQWYCEHRDWTIGTTRSSWPATSDKVKPFTRWADAGESVINSAFWGVTWGEKMRPGQEFQYTVQTQTSTHDSFQNFTIGYLGSNHIDITGLKFYRDGRLKENTSQSGGVTLTSAGIGLTTDLSGTDVRIRYEYGTNKLKYYTMVNSVRTHIATADGTLDGNPIFISVKGQRSVVPSATGIQVYGWEFAHTPTDYYNPWNNWRIGGFPMNVVGLSTGTHSTAITIPRDTVLRHKDGLPKGYQMKWTTADTSVGNPNIGQWKTSSAASGITDVGNVLYWDWRFQTGGDEDIDGPDMVGMTINTSNSNYVGGSDLEWADPNPGTTQIGLRYHTNNTIDLYDFTNSEVIATVNDTQDGNPVYISWGASSADITTSSDLVDDFFGGGDVTIEEIGDGVLSTVDTHLNVGTANTGDILTWGGSDYAWSAPSTIGAGNPVVNGSITGVGNSTLRLVLQDSGIIDIDLSTLNTTGSDDDINSRITKAVSFARTETSFLRHSLDGASHNMWDASFGTPGSTPLGMGSAADTHVSNHGDAQPFSQTLIFRNAGINTDRDSVLVGLSDGNTTDILASGVISHYIGISSTKKLVHHWGEPHILGIGTTQANRAELMDVKDDTFYGIFFDHDGQRFATGVTTSQLNSQFRYKVVDLSSGDVTDLTPNWTHYGKSQDGRGDSDVNSNLMYGALAGTTNPVSASNVHLRFEGDIAQASSITYQQGAVLLDDTQVSLMVRDPEKYLRDYKVGTSSRRPYYDTTETFALNLQGFHYQAAQVWLMGDGEYDILGGGIGAPGDRVKNFVSPSQFNLVWPGFPSYNTFTDVSVTTGPTFASTKSTKFENLDRATRSRQSGEFANLAKAVGAASSAYTLSFWFRPGNNTHENQNIFNAYSQSNTFEGTSIIQVQYNGNTGSTRNIRLNVQDQSGGLDESNYNLDLSTPVGDVTHTNGSNGFHHIAITNSGGSNAYQSSSLGIKIYINGVEQTLTDNSNGGGLPDAGIGTSTFSITPNIIALGRQPTNARYMRDSLVDELSFFNTELNATEVACLYNGGTPSNLANFTPGPAHWYRMGDGDSGTTIQDNVGIATLSMTNMSDANFVSIVPS